MKSIEVCSRLLLALVLSAALVACGGGSPQDSPPASSLRLDSAKSVTQTIGPAGGTLSTAAADGTAYTLTVPAKALHSATAITLTPIASIADLPAGVSLVGGAHLTPEGQRFDVPLKLSIALAAAPASAPVPFTYDGELQQRRLYPARVTGRTIDFEIVHFSGYAALLAQPDVIAFLLGGSGYLSAPGTAGDTALQQLVTAALTLTGEARASAMVAAMQGWLDGVIKPAVVAVQAFAAVDVDPPATPALMAMTRLRNEMQVFDVAAKYAVLAGADVVAIYGDFRVAVRDAARHVIPLFNAACDTTAAPILLAVPDIFAWQELAHRSGASALDPALERSAVLDALCVQVAYDPNGGTDFPSAIQPGQTGTLGVRAGYSVNGGPVRYDESMFVVLTGSSGVTPRGLLAPFAVAAGATLQQQFLWEPATTELRINIDACLAGDLLREICQQAFVVRGTAAGSCPEHYLRLPGATYGPSVANIDDKFIPDPANPGAFLASGFSSGTGARISVIGPNSAEARAVGRYRVRARTVGGSFFARLVFTAQHSTRAGFNGNATVTWPGGSDTAASTGPDDVRRPHEFTVRDGDLITITLTMNVSASGDSSGGLNAGFGLSSLDPDAELVYQLCR